MFVSKIGHNSNKLLTGHMLEMHRLAGDFRATLELQSMRGASATVFATSCCLHSLFCAAFTTA